MNIHRFCMQKNVSNFKCLFLRKYSSNKIGNVALITGASTGIGLMACEKLLKAGVSNIIMSSESEDGDKVALELRRKYRNACLCFCKCDVTKPKEMENLFDQALSMHGHLDIVINNAGIFNDSAWKKTIDINCKGVIYGLQLAMGCMSKERGGKGGAIINVASVLGMQPLAGAPVYAASKHFVIGLTRSYGMDYHYKKSGVRVMAICPGVTLTPLIVKAKKEITPMAQYAAKELDALPKQETCFVGAGFVTILKRGCSGSIWVVEGEEIYEVSIPDRQQFRI